MLLSQPIHINSHFSMDRDERLYSSNHYLSNYSDTTPSASTYSPVETRVGESSGLGYDRVDDLSSTQSLNNGRMQRRDDPPIQAFNHPDHPRFIPNAGSHDPDAADFHPPPPSTTTTTDTSTSREYARTSGDPTRASLPFTSSTNVTTSASSTALSTPFSVAPLTASPQTLQDALSPPVSVNNHNQWSGSSGSTSLPQPSSVAHSSASPETSPSLLPSSTDVTATTTATPQEPSKRRAGRKLPKEVTERLRKWLLDHADHPYPDENTKRQLCQLTNLSMSQICNWMINARRRILIPASRACLVGPSGSSTVPYDVSRRPTSAAMAAAHAHRSGLPPVAPVPHMATYRELQAQAAAVGPHRTRSASNSSYNASSSLMSQHYTRPIYPQARLGRSASFSQPGPSTSIPYSHSLPNSIHHHSSAPHMHASNSYGLAASSSYPPSSHLESAAASLGLSTSSSVWAPDGGAYSGWSQSESSIPQGMVRQPMLPGARESWSPVSSSSSSPDTAQWSQTIQPMGSQQPRALYVSTSSATPYPNIDGNVSGGGLGGQPNPHQYTVTPPPPSAVQTQIQNNHSPFQQYSPQYPSSFNHGHQQHPPPPPGPSSL